VVNIRLALIGKRTKLAFPSLPEAGTPKPSHQQMAYFSDARKPIACPVYQRGELSAGARIAGPALIQEHGTTTVLFELDVCTASSSGELIIDVGGAP
jgi:N-methylhydantoinase A